MTVRRNEIQLSGLTMPVYSMNTLVIGSGAAGLNAAVQVFDRGQESVAVVTERWGGGTSFEAGSDKQTYYKLSLAHDAVDSPRRMAEDLCRGGCMHGDIALCEAQHSAEAFYHLVALGVPFPHDRYGAYIGYRTDDDPAGRATSAGPLTSRMMGERLGEAVRSRGIRVLDRHQVIALLTVDEKGGRHVCGAVAIDSRNTTGEPFGLVLLNAVNVVLATGGPGGLYETSVYPESQWGSTGLGLAVGAAGQNLTEWQFGVASIGFRWNLSGSYQQAIPRYVSTDAAGREEREFLREHFPDMATLGSAVFRKGYEWPFDCEKIAGHGSSLIDLLVFEESVSRGRRVFLDYTADAGAGPGGEPLRLESLDDEARSYLEKSGALCATPVERLRAMNEPAYQLFRGHGIDLRRDRLEIAVCAQHNNGGLKGDIWWESNIRHLFPIGEVNGTHGVRRPGGTALNAGQVGALRAAMYITKRYAEEPPEADVFAKRAQSQIEACIGFARAAMERGDSGRLAPAEVLGALRRRMTRCGGIVRDGDEIGRETEAAWALLRRARRDLAVGTASELPAAFRAVDSCLTHVVYLEAMREYLIRGGGSRGSALVVDTGGAPPHEKLRENRRCRWADPHSAAATRILEVRLNDADRVDSNWVEVRPVPKPEAWFERVWRAFLDDDVIR